MYQKKSPSNDSLKSLHKTIKKITEDIEKLSLNTCISSFMICVNELSSMSCNNREVLQDLLILISPLHLILLRSYGVNWVIKNQ